MMQQIFGLQFTEEEEEEMNRDTKTRAMTLDFVEASGVMPTSLLLHVIGASASNLAAFDVLW